MAYQTSWALESNAATYHAKAVIRTLNEALEKYMDWQTFRAGRTNAQIAVALGRDEADIAALDSCFSAFKEMYDFANNVASPSQSDRYYSMRLFT